MSFKTIAGGFNGASDGMVHFLKIKNFFLNLPKLSCGFKPWTEAIMDFALHTCDVHVGD